MFLGGQSIPISIQGASLEWKKAQKNDMKNNTSDTMNKTIPIRILVSTSKEWCPWRAASRDTSRHHCTEVRMIINTPINIRRLELPLNQLTVPAVIIKAPKALVRGQGLWSTIW